MKRCLLLYNSIIGKKAIVAVTGVILLGFLLLHVAGNLKAFLPDPSPGVPDIDVYAEFLRTAGEPAVPHEGVLWLTRIVLLGALLLHVVCVVQLTLHNRRARPVGYLRQKYTRATLPARSMLYTGILVLVFVVLHILHFTTGTLDPERFEEGTVYANLHAAFQLEIVLAMYLVGLAVVALHLYHGVWSLFQSLGADTPDRNRGLRMLALVLAVFLFLGFAAVPVAFFSGMMQPPPESATSTTAQMPAAE